MAEHPDAAAYVFLSYTSSDRARALALADALEAAGVTVWLDRSSIAGGTSWGSEIVEGIKNCAALLILCSTAALQSRNVKQEIQLAWRYERAYVPLLLEPIAFPEQVQYFLEGWQWVELLDQPESVWLPVLLKALARLGVSGAASGVAREPSSPAAASSPAAGSPAPARTEAATAAPRAAPAQPLTLPEASTFVGRADELGKLRTALAAAIAGQGRLVLLAGEPGIGKTRLAQHLAQEAPARGCLVLWGRCWEGEGAPAYRPWVEVLRTAVRTADPGDLAALLGAGAGDVAQLVPELGVLLPDLPPVAPLEGEQGRFRLFDAVTAFVNRLAERAPLLIVLDDLHWADKPSLVLLQFLVRELPNARLLVLNTYRDMEVDRTHPLAEVLPTLRRERAFLRLLLHGLNERETGALTEIVSGEQLRSGSQGLIAALHRETEGNPFFLQETVRHLLESGRLVQRDDRWQLSTASIAELGIPEGVREVVGRRLSHLSEACNRVLRVAAVIGRSFGVRMLEEVSDTGDDELIVLLEEAELARLIEAVKGGGEQYQFSHALVRETLYGELAALRRTRLHRRVAEALERHSSVPRAAELAYHYGQAGEAFAAQAIRYSRQAAEQAEAATAWEEAARHYQQCLGLLEDLDDRPDVDEAALLTALGRCYRYAGEPRAAWRNLMRAITAYQAHGDGCGQARATLEALQIMAPLERRQALANDALAALGAADPYLEAQLLLILSGRGTSDATVSADLLARASALAHDHGFIDIATAIRLSKGVQLLNERRFAEAGTAMQTGQRNPLGMGALDFQGGRYTAVAFPAYLSGDLKAGETISRELLALTRRVHLRGEEGLVLLPFASAQLARGDLAGCAALLEESQISTWALDLRRATLASMRGDLPQAVALLPESERGGGVPQSTAGIYAGRACVRFRAGDESGSQRELAAWREVMARMPPLIVAEVPSQFHTFWADECLPALGDEAVVRTLYERYADWPEVRYELFTGRSFDQFTGMLALRLGEIDAAEQHFRTGLAWCERERCPIEQARCLEGLAEVAARRGEATAAMACFTRAAALFEAHGAVFYLTRLRARQEALTS
ncbi:MAG: AAA family ATPase [Dehalococcoidia bacterium]